MNQGDHQDQAKVSPLTDTLLLPCRRGDGDKISTVLIEYSYLKSNPELCLFDKKSNSMVYRSFDIFVFNGHFKFVLLIDLIHLFLQRKN